MFSWERKGVVIEADQMGVSISSARNVCHRDCFSVVVQVGREEDQVTACGVDNVSDLIDRILFSRIDGDV